MENGWISVNDSLPEVGENVAVIVIYANQQNVHEDKIIRFYPDDGTPEWGEYAQSCVTHWIKLPNKD